MLAKILKETKMLKKIDLRAAFSREPEPQDFVLPGLLACTTGALITPPSIDRSQFALQLACAVASAAPQANTTGIPVDKHGPVLYISPNATVTDVQRRLQAIGEGWSADTVASVVGSLVIKTLDATESRFASLFDIIDQLDSTQWRLIILDTSFGFPGYSTSNRKEMMAWVLKLESFALKTEAAVLGVYDSDTVHDYVTSSARWGADVDNLQLSDKTEFERKTGLKFEESRLSSMYRFQVFCLHYSPPDTHAVWYEKSGSTLLKPVF